MNYKISKSDKEWKKILTPEQFDVCRKKSTERAFTGIYYDTKDMGTYNCSCCATNFFHPVSYTHLTLPTNREV